jgi:hypothetical protein
LQPDILGLITELAVYEKEPDAVKATPEMVSRHRIEILMPKHPDPRLNRPALPEIGETR